MDAMVRLDLSNRKRLDANGFVNTYSTSSLEEMKATCKLLRLTDHVLIENQLQCVLCVNA